jgi:hypothetical protein
MSINKKKRCVLTNGLRDIFKIEYKTGCKMEDACSRWLNRKYILISEPVTASH